MRAQDEYDQGLTLIQEKIRNIEQVKLPTLNIPYFDGNFGAWRNFHDNFVQAIHHNNQLGHVQKMQYLKAYTKGEANKIIRHLQSANDYETAWKY